MDSGHNKPTVEFYDLLQQAYDHFNTRLFDGQLPPCMITVQRKRNTMGYFSPQRWVNADGRKTHEIALNPAYFGNHSLIEIFQTLGHEQCHLWQYEFGKPVRASYHNREWADKMLSIGLIPSDTSQPGGKQTGQRMADYPEPGGKFLQACIELMGSGFSLPWVDRVVAASESCHIRPLNHPEQPQQTPAQETEKEILLLLETPISDLVPGLAEPEEVKIAARAKQKTRYHCSGCNTNVWGKPGLKITCGECNLPFEIENK